MSENVSAEVAVWRIAAEGDCDYLLSVADENFLLEAVKPGDVFLLLDSDGEKAWAARRVFLVRREMNRTIVYFDRALDFASNRVEVPFVGSGDKCALRRMDIETFNEILLCAHPPHPTDPENPTEDDCLGWSYDALCARAMDDTPRNRVFVRQMLETIVKDDLLGPAQGPEEEIVGMSVRDRYILGRLGPRRVDEFGPVPTDAEINEADESDDVNKDGNEDHAEHDENKTPGTDIAEEEPEEDVADAIDVTRSSSIVPSSMGLTFCIDEALPDIEVVVSWGSYYRTKSEMAVNPQTGNPLNCWKRVPFGGKKILKLKEGNIAEYNPDERIGTVSVIGNVSRSIDGLRLVTLFLVNKQMEPKENRDAAWLFQPEIIVRSPDGTATF